MIAGWQAIPVSSGFIHVEIINKAFGRDPWIGTLPAVVGVEVTFVVDTLIEFTVAENWLHSGSHKEMRSLRENEKRLGYRLLRICNPFYLSYWFNTPLRLYPSLSLSESILT